MMVTFLSFLRTITSRLYTSTVCFFLVTASCLPVIASASTPQWRWNSFQSLGKTTPASDYSYSTFKTAIEALGRIHFNGFLDSGNHTNYFYKLSDGFSCDGATTNCNGKIEIEHCYTPDGVSPGTRDLWRANAVQSKAIPATNYVYPDGISAMQSQAQTHINHLADSIGSYMYHYWAWGTDNCAGATHSCGGWAIVERCYMPYGYSPETRNMWGPKLYTHTVTGESCGTRGYPYASAEEAMNSQLEACVNGENESHSYQYLSFYNQRYSNNNVLDGQPETMYADYDVLVCEKASSTCVVHQMGGVPVVRGACWNAKIPLSSQVGSCQILQPTLTASVQETEEPDPKNLGECRKNNPINAGNPIHISTGNKHQKEYDYHSINESPLSFARHYNSRSNTISILGRGWSHTYSRHIDHYSDKVSLFRHDGKILKFSEIGGLWNGEPDVSGKLEQTASGWIYTANNWVEVYDSQGRLATILSQGSGLEQQLSYNDKGQLENIVGPFQRSIVIDYDDLSNLLTSVSTPDGIITYDYDASGNLTTVTRTDGSQRLYHYNEQEHTAGINRPHTLTGITDERGTRYATYEYDINGLAVASYHGAVSAVLADRVDGITINRDAGGFYTVTKSNGGVTTYSTENSWNTGLVNEITGPACSSCGGSNTIYERNPANNQLLAKTENGVTTTYIRDETGQELSRTEAVGTPEARTITTEWHLDFRKPVRITEPGRITEYTYDTAGRLLSKTERAAP